jgi:DNA polymerase III gamma/tau subunit
MLSLYRRHRPRTFDEVVGQEDGRDRPADA